MKPLKRSHVSFWTDAILNSYSQLFFSEYKVLAVLIMTASFFTPSIGAGGLLAIIITNVLAILYGLDKERIRSGSYGYNALLLGLALCYEFQHGFVFFILFVFGILFLLVVSTFLQGVLDKYSLPYLTFPFLIGWWMIKLASGNFTELQLSESHVFIINEMAKENILFKQVVQLEHHVTQPLLKTYLQTLSSVVFQHSLIPGILIALGVLLFSRILFTLSILGFTAAFGFYTVAGADINDLVFFLSGSNYMFMAMAVGGYFVVPNRYSYLAVLTLIPVTVFVLISFAKILQVFQLQTFTLAFSTVVISFLQFLHQRKYLTGLKLVLFHYKNPEEQVYNHHVSLSASRSLQQQPLMLPFFGTWKVSQGYDGKITHLGPWSKALDFVVTDDHDSTYGNEGMNVEDYYCYNKPVLAPLDGYVYEIVNHVEDNAVGGVNTEKNWGNTIVLNHLNGLYSQLSHLKKDSIQVAVGQYVTQGTMLAHCGNSGRSPEPHIHFQMQASPEIGSPALSYPIRYFITEEKGGTQLNVSKVPQENDVVTSIEINPSLISAFNFLPGQKIRWMSEDKNVEASWEIFTNAWNQKYILCNDTGSVAWFQFDGTMFYFTGFTGDRKSILFSFYKAAYRVFLGHHEDIITKDEIPVSQMQRGILRWTQDLLAPLLIFTHVQHTSKRSFTNASEGEVQAAVSYRKTIFKTIESFRISIKENKMYSLQLPNNQTLLCVI